MNVLDILRGTPFWVYLVFLYLVKRGLSAAKDRNVELKKLCITPAIFSILTIHTLSDRVAHNIFYLLIWILVFAFSIFLGQLHISRLNITANRSNGTLDISGSYITLVLLVCIFLSKYYYGVVSSVNPTLAHSAGTVLFVLIVSGISTGMMWGRFLGYMRAYLR